MTDILDELHWRGLIAESTDEQALRAELAAGPITYYCGFDPTAPSLHIGNLVQLLAMSRFQQAGNTPLALVGGATGLIGDPKMTGERTLNDRDTVAGWVERIRRQIEPLLDFEGTYAARMVNNLDWTAELSAIDFLRDVGKHFRVGRMIAKESVSARLNSEQGISFAEFSYQILQGMDFLELYRRYGCRMQTGGHDQWGNLTSGVDLVHRVERDSVHAVATPLITKADGTKFGKTEAGTVWLDPTMTSPYAFYQFWVNADDRDVVSYLKVFSFRDRDQIAELENEVAQRPAARAAQRALAEDVTAMVHGPTETAKAVAASRALFGMGALEELEADTLRAALDEAGAARLPVGDELPTYVELLSEAGVVDSRSAARRALTDGGAYINNRRLPAETAPDARPERDELLHGRWLVLRRGKRTVGGVELV
ncbi:tyrosyl-tRNA synthetase [Haloactinopolyspora alba]|uniref:Tyrosine--tRNA ligase n=1 Tax=Haloactinopolyspora alba TaxID=648780 RepID=A0A2P8D2H7_9ACTN|nr:tyrosine--tRNA ligase [Haloactinopolyspora alba]PSK91399.1 tyrosyl-tRNA synthetase [Haloactinopolyspora alba]